MNKGIKNLILGAALAASGSGALAQDDLGVTPYLHPKACPYTLDASGYNILTSKDCDVVYLAPLPIEKTSSDIKIYNSVGLCEGLNIQMEGMTLQSRTIADLQRQSNEAFAKGDDALGEKKMNLAEKVGQALEKAQARYGAGASFPGASVTSHFKNNMTETDIHNFNEQNMELFLTMAKNNIPIPDVKIAPTKNSIYSFVHYRAPVAGESVRSIISTEIPGLDALVQPTAKQANVAHIKGKDSITGNTVFSLMSACNMVEPVGNGKVKDWVAKPDALRNVMTVTRTYNIPLKVGYTSEARLNTDVASDVFAKHIVNTENRGLSKSQFYESLLKIEGTEVFSVIIDTDGGQITAAEQEGLQNKVRQRLVDRYLAFYESRGDLADLSPVDLGAPTGGNVPVNYVGTHCWSNSGFLGIGGSSGCSDYIYTVQEWREGKNFSQISDYLKVNLDISEKTLVNTMIDYEMSTSFFDQPVAKIEAGNEPK